ncbi:glycerophosphodiester phosphodiesterase [Alkalibacillus almallahensis]|uniref:glycerophosphodiester phosphodiesterase n=1 Tax=Alkalibacillus almallahensis TaxID=1379154 RepID=UPI001420DE4B|nr:glycerophosphodiester phosphodiesterase [Alkalibacillus almallahensis]
MVFKFKLNKVIIVSLVTVVLLYIGFNVIVFHPVESKLFFEKDRPMVIAHQGGEELRPSSTMAAFKHADQLGVDALETDLHISEDGYLMNIHDATVDRTTDGTGLVANLTLEELKELDAGYYFTDPDGHYAYRGKGLELITLNELFQAFPNQKFILEIKATNPDHRIDEMITRLINLIDQYNMQDKVLIGSFDHNIIKQFQRKDPFNVATSGGRQEIRDFVLTHKLWIRNLYNPSIDAVSIPTSDSGFDLTSNSLLDGAERLGLEVFYWTINDEETMRELLKSGADGIITDRPDLLIEVIQDLEKEK